MRTPTDAGGLGMVDGLELERLLYDRMLAHPRVVDMTLDIEWVNETHETRAPYDFVVRRAGEPPQRYWYLDAKGSTKYPNGFVKLQDWRDRRYRFGPLFAYATHAACVTSIDDMPVCYTDQDGHVRAVDYWDRDCGKYAQGLVFTGNVTLEAWLDDLAAW